MVAGTYVPVCWNNALVAIIFFVTTLSLIIIKEDYKRAKVDVSANLSFNINEQSPFLPEANSGKGGY